MKQYLVDFGNLIKGSYFLVIKNKLSFLVGSLLIYLFYSDPVSLGLNIWRKFAFKWDAFFEISDYFQLFVNFIYNTKVSFQGNPAFVVRLLSLMFIFYLGVAILYWLGVVGKITIISKFVYNLKGLNIGWKDCFKQGFSLFFKAAIVIIFGFFLSWLILGLLVFPITLISNVWFYWFYLIIAISFYLASFSFIFVLGELTFQGIVRGGEIIESIVFSYHLLMKNKRIIFSSFIFLGLLNLIIGIIFYFVFKDLSLGMVWSGFFLNKITFGLFPKAISLFLLILSGICFLIFYSSLIVFKIAFWTNIFEKLSSKN